MSTLPPLRSLQIFEAVVRCGSMAAAAEEACISSGAVSQQIKTLESFLGARIFERRGRSLELTPWGRIYYRHIENAFDEIRQAQAVLAKARTRSDIALSALPSLAIRWLRPLVQAWQTENPGSSILLVGTDEEPLLDGDGIDFRITYGDGVRRFDQYCELFVDSIVPACAPALLRRLNLRTPIDVLDAPLISIEWENLHRRPPSWQDWAASLGVTRDVPGGLAFSLSSAAIDAAAAGGGFVLGQRSMIEEEVVAGRLVVPFAHSLPMPQPYFLAWTRSVLDTPFGPRFKTCLQHAARSQARHRET